MKKMLKLLNRVTAMATILGLLFLPLMADQAMAQGRLVTSSGSCSDYTDAITCNNNTPCYWGNGICQAPEMSDYLAMGFVIIAGGMIYHFRRRAVASA